MVQVLTKTPFSGTTLAEAITAEGNRYSTEFDNVFNAAETKYYLYQFPSELDTIVSLQNRQFKSLKGEAELVILWNSTGIVPGVPVPIFNENRNSANISKALVSEIATPLTDGIIREQDFLTGVGGGSHSSGSISTDSGYRMYSPGSFFIAKVTNLHNNANRIRLAYSWVEIPLKALG